MTARGKLVGVIDMQSARVNAYTEYDRALMRLIAARVSIAIDNARLYRRVERQNRTLKTLANISREFSSILDLNVLLGKIASTMRDLINYDAFSILLVDHDDQSAPPHHGDRKFGAHRVHGVQVSRIVAHVADQKRLAARGGDSGDALAQRDREVADHVFAMAHRVADAQIAAPLAVEQDCKQVVGQHLSYDFGHVGEQLVQVERQRGGSRGFEEEIEQLRSLLETNRGFSRVRQRWPRRSSRWRWRRFG
jgi:sigma-B regulation protein RsbU (phosphoserine phosphatase)